MLLFGILLFVIGCNPKELFSDKDLEAIITEKRELENNERNTIKITQPDSLKTIIKYLNNGKKEPVKFFPTYKIKLAYRNGSELTIFANDHLIKYEGQTYRLNQNMGKLYK